MKKLALVLMSFVGACLSGCTDHPIVPNSNEVLAWRAGGTSSDQGQRIAVDGNGNTYVIGIFEGIASFGTTTLTSTGKSDVFIAKYNSVGEAQWAKKVGGTGIDLANGIALDGSGSVYIVGTYTGAATFGSTTLTSTGGLDLFIAKLNGMGEVQWAQTATGLNAIQGLGLSVDGSGNAYVTGVFQGAATFGSTTLTSTGSDDVFIAKYNASGQVLWAKQAGGTGTDIGRSIAVDGSGNVYVTGTFTSTATFSSTTLTSSGFDDAFVAKYNGSGDLQWAKQAGGSNGDSGNGIAVDGSGNVYVTGSFWGTATFGSATLTSGGLVDAFVTKYNGSGDLQWAKQAGGGGSDFGAGITVDADGNAYVTGTFSGTATFDAIALISNGENDAFVAKYNGNGVAQWAKKAGGAGGDQGRGIALDGSGNVYVIGTFWGTATFGTTMLTSSGDNDVFVAKFKN